MGAKRMVFTKSATPFSERPGAETPDRALGDKSMRQQELNEFVDVGHACPWDGCGRGFDSVRGMKIHHKQAHGESIAGVLVECGWCGTPFREEPHRIEKYGTVYCNMGCFAEDRSEKYQGENHPNWKESGELECEWCGGVYEVVPAKTDGSRFCSRRCLADWRSENRNGQNHPTWRGGRSIYNAVKRTISKQSWTSIRDEYREMVGYECEWCGGECERNAAELDVHHLIPVLCGGTNEAWNLVALCKSCHTTAENYTRKLLTPALTP